MDIMQQKTGSSQLAANAAHEATSSDDIRADAMQQAMCSIQLAANNAQQTVNTMYTLILLIHLISLMIRKY